LNDDFDGSYKKAEKGQYLISIFYKEAKHYQFIQMNGKEDKTDLLEPKTNI
jgi:hypothetical protein